MALDFPASPTVGQQYISGNTIWTWDGTKWAASGVAVAYVPLAGGTMTGQLILNADPGSNLAAATKQYADAGDTAVATSHVAKAGDTMTGTLTIGNGQSLILDAPSGTARNFDGTTNGSFRWNMQFGNATAESGVSGGSDFALSRFNNSGSYIDSPLIILRGNGVLQAVDGISAPNVLGDNRLINGDMRIDQRNNGAAGTAQGYTCDRWFFNGTQTGKGQWQRTGNGPGGVAATGVGYSLGFTSASAYTPLASDVFSFNQRIEADMATDFAWGTVNAQPVTLSFWVYCSLTGTFGGSINGGRSYPFSYSIPAANTWTKIVVTIPGDTAGSWTLQGSAEVFRVQFDLGSGSTFRGPTGAWATANYVGATGAASIVATNGAAFNVTGVKLEVGLVATPFNHPPLAQALAACQRYYQQVNATIGAYAPAGATTPAGNSIPFPVAMRATPSAVWFNGPSYANASGASVTIQIGGFYIGCQVLATGLFIVNGMAAFSAEL